MAVAAVVKIFAFALENDQLSIWVDIAAGGTYVQRVLAGTFKADETVVNINAAITAFAKQYAKDAMGAPVGALDVARLLDGILGA